MGGDARSMIGRMALQDAILAALFDDESSGYDLAKSFDITVANYWTASPQQLYRELDRMETAGLVQARVVAQAKRPDKRVFRLTASGRKALQEFTAREPKPIAIRDELLVQVEAMDTGDSDAVREHVAAMQAAARTKLERYLRRRDKMLAGRTEDEYLAQEERIGAYLTLARGILFEKENVRWARMTLKVLDART